MKALICAAFAAAAVAAPSFAFAQASNAPVTRAEVRADLIRVEQAGYHPGGDDINYPADIQAAEARVQATSGDHAYGGASNDSAVGTAMPGAPVQNSGQ
jgi:Domain of unknown function (DUF4148)